MRQLLGVLALVGGVAGLAIWGATHNAVDMEAKIAARAAQVVAGARHGLSVDVSGRDISVSGYVDSLQKRDDMRAALDAIVGRRVVRDDLTVLPKVDPFTFEVTKEGARVLLSGHVPSEAARAQLLADQGPRANGAAQLTLAAGAPAGWDAAAAATIGAVAPLTDGAATLSGASVMVSGTAATPAEEQQTLAALAALPDGYDSDVLIEVLDDGEPEFTVTYDATGGASLDGKLPAGLSDRQVADVLGLPIVADDVPTSFGEDPGAVQALTSLRAWLPEFDRLSVTRSQRGSSIKGEVMPGVDAELLKDGLLDALPGADIALEASGRNPVEGATRTNVATLQNEVFASGFWLPRISFEADKDSCDRQSRAVLDGTRVNFVTGSARLGARATRAINALAAVARVCVLEAGLTLELGGHTDNTGDAPSNLALSEARAQAVRVAFLERGIPADAMQAKGFGDSQPIADNATDAGRAANRRTTLTWSLPDAETAPAATDPTTTTDELE